MSMFESGVQLDSLQSPTHPALLAACTRSEIVTANTLETLLAKAINPCMFRNLQDRIEKECVGLSLYAALRHRFAVILRHVNAAIEMNVDAGSVAEFANREYRLGLAPHYFSVSDDPCCVKLFDTDSDGAPCAFVSYDLPESLLDRSDLISEWPQSDIALLVEFMQARGWAVSGLDTNNPIVRLREC
ncbi:hypothetical protein KPA07_06235 [Corynebacterium aurimucosum]|uniref:hypothetical protein n=1 Tax=Corynebacterium aurimucosum TaxID=169292 RepID=UPI001C0F06C1|nr:hypothetical protein [Corynebacterium aurimucosum]MBU5654510.1 hypothetical protein [Corynebacterium aurimucosum]